MGVPAEENRGKPASVIRWADGVLRRAGVDKTNVLRSNFLDYADTVRDIISGWPKRRLERWHPELEGLKAMRDDFETVVRRDPACIYIPANEMARRFERSLAKIRYIHGGNRISKTESCAIDNYRIVTRQHPFRPLPPPGGSVFIIGVDFKNYAGAVFETKYVYGEAGNPLSPLFPEDGKWFYHYDPRKHILTIACPDCAEAGKAQQCPGHHVKSIIRLFSDYEKPSSLAGAQYAQGQLDEQIGYGFWAEGLKRLETVPHSGMVVSETPVLGKAWWTYRVLKLSEKLPPEENVVPGTARPLVDVFSCTQFEGGLVPHEEIYASMQLMTEPEIRARIYGEHIAASENAIFDLEVLLEMRNETTEPMRGVLYLDTGEEGRPSPEDPYDPDHTPSAILGKMKQCDSGWLKLREDENGGLRIFAPPCRFDQYLISADVAKGLTKGDYSAADVWRIYPDGVTLALEQVAQWHGYVNSSEYGEILMKLGIWYNSAVVAVERSGPGDATINKLRELGYWALYIDLSSPTATRLQFDQAYGVDTNMATKPVMISLMKSVIKDKNTGRRTLILHCLDSIEELENFIQEPSESGRNMTFHGAGTFHDDRVMSAAVAVYVVKTNPDAIYDFSLAERLNMESVIDNRDVMTKKFWKSVHQNMGKSKRAQT